MSHEHPLTVSDRISIIRGKKSIDGLSDKALIRLIKMAAEQFLLPRLVASQGQALLSHHGVTESRVISGLICDHMTFSAFDQDRLRFEAEQIARVLADTIDPVILLKGGAYVMADKQAGTARRVSDLDILVPREQLARAERQLLGAGWAFVEETDTPYNQVYYRQYMHELPPMVHTDRNAVLDVHHRILPQTARMSEDIDAMIKAAVAVSGTGFKRFSDIDLYLHAAVHHCVDGDFTNPARAVVELLDLFDDCAGEVPHQGVDIFARAEALGLTTAAAYALLLLYRFGGVMLAPEVLVACSKQISPLVLKALSVKLVAGLENGDAGLGEKSAQALLYLRSHLLRMPLRLLLPHLGRKMGQAISRRVAYYRRRLKDSPKK